MDATQMINDSILESDEEENEEENENKRGRPLAKLCILKNQHIPEAELPLFLGENILGRDPNTCTVPLPAASISKQHAAICISVYRRRGCHSEVDAEALVWDLGSMNGTRKGHLKLTPNVRYALSERDRLLVADIPCQYVSCAVDIVSSQGDTISVSRNSGVKARLADASGEKGGDTSTGGKKCVNGGTNARVSLSDLEDTGKTPVRMGCLTFEQTPTQPQGTLVPESDSDSEGERGVGNRRQKAFVSDSDKSSPTCSTFLSPTNKIASVDESPITPSSSAKNRPSRHVSFSMDTDIYVGRQQLKEKKALVIVDDSEEEEERAALGGRKSDGCNVSLTGEDESPVSTAAVAIPAFNMDSDTDVEGEEEGVACAGPMTLNTNQQADQPPNTAQFHMDSDTDVDEDDDAIDKIPKSVPSSADNAKPPHVISVIQPEAITMDSDTDVDDDAVVSDSASEAKPVSFQSTETADSAPSMQMKDFYLDSDTDVDEEEEKGSRTINTCSEIDETPTRLDIKSTGAESAAVTAHSLHLDSDTDDETVPAPVISELSAASAVTESCIAEDTGSDVDALSDKAPQSDSDADTDVDEPSVPPAGDGANPADLRVDSDTDVEAEEVDFRSAGDGQVPSLQRENTPGLLVPLLQNCSTPVQEAPQSDSDADTDVDEPSVPPAGDGVNPADLKVDSDTDVEDEEVDFRSAGDGQVPSLQRGNTPGLLVPLLQNCSTPVQGSQEDEDFVVAETQSFILQTRHCQDNTPEDHSKPPNRAFGPESSGDENDEQSSRQGSFQLGLSDSSHLQDQAQVLAMESTQAFVSVERGLNMEEARTYAERTSVENESNLEATQDYGEDEEPARCSVTSEIEDQEEECLDEENPFCSGLQVKARPQNETQETEEPEEDEPQARTLSKALSIAETQPMHASDNEESDEEDLIPGPRRGKAQPLQPEDEQTEPFTSSELSLAETQPAHICVDETQPVATSGNVESDVGDSIRHTSSELSAVEGQPMDTGKDGESDEEDSIPASRKRKAKPLQLEDESQTLTHSELSAVEAQPTDTREDGESDDDDSMPVIRKRKAKPLQLEDESQTLTHSELTAVEAQPVVTGDDGETEEEDSLPLIRKRREKPLQLEESQALTNSELSAVEAQPTDTREDEETDEEDSMPVIRKRKAKPLRLEDESQTLTNSEPSAVEAQPVVTGDDGESDDEDSVPGLRRRKAKPLQIQEEETQTLTSSEASTVETQPLETDSDLQPQRGKGGQSEVGTSGITIREMSASSVSTPESSGRGRGRGAKRTSEPPPAAAVRSSNRRRTVDAGPTPQGVRSRSNSNSSLNSEISSCSLNSQSRGRGGRQRGRGRGTETDSLINSQRDQNSAPKSPARGRKSRKADESCNAVSLEDVKEKADSQQASTTRGQRRANANGSKPAAADEKDSSYQEEGCATDKLVPP
ncbi:Mediator of DNA damage checkpoint protein 1 [Collichthys lucidus]|uniref:Mediator of DNA damage checkpoint protein 1 n=1 Tax=Collichthys lucidus TaxID=240159 RepID=A0A4U5V6X0_COLLU|nr:Mediator of DNA damage checkpoint protein 1 [Collichthys lucidus]